jgi:DNA (cytosine-5)-methyltransferase 3A
MGCLGIALKDIGFQFDYYTSEIDKHAVAQSKLNFPDSIQLGDVTKWRDWDIDWSNIDLIGAGSPCQGFSFAGKQLAFDDPRSALFFVFVEILEHCKKHNSNVKFLLENVKMKKEYELVITKYLNVAPIEINAALVSAQNRRRLFWTNIANEPYGLFGDMQCIIPQPKDKGILLKDVLESEVDEKYYLSDKMIKGFIKHTEKHQAKGNGFRFDIKTEQDKSNCVTSRCHKMGVDDNYIVASRGRNPENLKSRESGLNTEQMLEPRYDGKTNCLTSVQKDNLVMQLNGSTESGGKQPYQQNRVYDINGISPALMAQMSCGTHAILVPEATKKGYAEIEPGECFDLTMPKSETRRGRLMEDKSNCLTAAKFDFMQYTEDYKIRRLTPTECARLQSIPTWYKWNCSDTQVYKMCGNGWNVEVIKHILKYL